MFIKMKYRINAYVAEIKINVAILIFNIFFISLNRSVISIPILTFYFYLLSFFLFILFIKFMLEEFCRNLSRMIIRNCIFMSFMESCSIASRLV